MNIQHFDAIVLQHFFPQTQLAAKIIHSSTKHLYFCDPEGSYVHRGRKNNNVMVLVSLRQVLLLVLYSFTLNMFLVLFLN